MFHCIENTVFVHGVGHIICCCFHIILGIAHRYTDACMAKHADVVPTVTERHGFFQLEAEMLDELVDTVLFGVPLGGDVHKGVIPSAELTVRHLWGYGLFVFCREERSQLIDFMAGCLFETYLRKLLYT